jgi:hypothetical protein
MPQQDELACEMKHSKRIVSAVLPTIRGTAEVLKRCKEPFISPPAPVAAQDAAVLRVVFPIATVGGRSSRSGVGQFPIQTIGIVCVITDQMLYRFGDEEVRQRLLDDGYLVRCCRLHTDSDRQTSAVCRRHDLCPRGPLSLTHSCSPFLCRGKASINEGFFKRESTTKAQIFGQSRQHTPGDT